MCSIISALLSYGFSHDTEQKSRKWNILQNSLEDYNLIQCSFFSTYLFIWIIIVSISKLCNPIYIKIMDFLHEYISFYSLCKSVRYFYQYWYVESSEIENSVCKFKICKRLFRSFSIFKSLWQLLYRICWELCCHSCDFLECNMVLSGWINCNQHEGLHIHGYTIELWDIWWIVGYIMTQKWQGLQPKFTKLYI